MPRVVSSSSSSSLRQSCRVCRARKIKCSSGERCSFCQSRGILCVYDVKSSFGRPKAEADTVCSGLLPGIQAAVAVELLFHNLFGNNSGSGIDELSNGFSAPAASPFAATVRSFLSTRALGLRPTEADLQEQIPCGPPVYDAILPLMIRDVIDCSIEHRTAPSSLKARGTIHYALGLVRDATQGMYTKSGHGEDLTSKAEEILDSGAWSTLVLRWMDWHPLSCLVTPLQRSQLLAASPSEQATLSQMAALSYLVEAESKGHPPHRSEEIFAQTVIEKGPDVLSAALNALLLAWNHFCHIRAKKGTVYFAFTCQLLQSADAQRQIAASPTQGRILQSLCRSLTVWIYSQLDTTDAKAWKQVADQLPTDFPNGIEEASSNENGSAVRRQVWVLERASIVALRLITGSERQPRMGPSKDTALQAAIGTLQAIKYMALCPPALVTQEITSLLACCDAVMPVMKAIDDAARPPEIFQHPMRSRLPYLPSQTRRSEDLPLLCVIAWLHLDYASQILTVIDPTASRIPAVKKMLSTLATHANSAWLQPSITERAKVVIARLAQLSVSHSSPDAAYEKMKHSSSASLTFGDPVTFFDPLSSSSPAELSSLSSTSDHSSHSEGTYDWKVSEGETILPSTNMATEATIPNLHFWGPLPELDIIFQQPSQQDLCMPSLSPSQGDDQCTPAFFNG